MMSSNEPQGVVEGEHSRSRDGSGLGASEEWPKARAEQTGAECEEMRSRQVREPDAVGGRGTSEAMVTTLHFILKSHVRV